MFKIMTEQLTLKAPITTAADGKISNIFPNFKKKGIIFHENRLPADDSHEISSHLLFLKKKRQIIGGALRINVDNIFENKKPELINILLFTC